MSARAPALVVFPRSVEEAVTALGERRAGGTDLMERRQRGTATGPLVDLRDVPELDRIEEIEGALRIGARVSIARVAESSVVRARHPLLAAAAGALATPQIRAVATVGGNLLQRTRCWYLRSPEYLCLKRGGAACDARGGDSLFSGAYDLSPCIAPHPSTLGAALLALDARVVVAGAEDRSIAGLYDVLATPAREHSLPEGALLTHVVVPATPGGRELGGYHRTIHRSRAEWPLVEACVRLVLGEGGRTIQAAAVAVGGVAPTPLRLAAVEAALIGPPLSEELLDAAAVLAVVDAPLLPQSGYKAALLGPTVRDALRLAVAEGIR